MYIFVRVCIYIYIHTYIPTYIHTDTPTYVRTYVHTYIHTSTLDKAEFLGRFAFLPRLSFLGRFASFRFFVPRPGFFCRDLFSCHCKLNSSCMYTCRYFCIACVELQNWVTRSSESWHTTYCGPCLSILKNIT